jgi:hypothetical protein
MLLLTTHYSLLTAHILVRPYTNQVTAWLMRHNSLSPDDRREGLPFGDAHVISLPDDAQSPRRCYISVFGNNSQLT